MNRLAVLLVFFFTLVVPLSGSTVWPGPASTRAGSPNKAAQSNPAMVGAWGPVIPRHIIPVHLSVLPNGKLLYWSRDRLLLNGADIDGACQVHVWDMATDTTTAVNNSTTNLFCSGHSFLPDGRLLVTGGHDVPVDPSGIRHSSSDGAGERHLNLFDFRINKWTRGPDMANGRWYPYNVTLGTGETAIVSGSYLTGFLPQSDGTYGLDFGINRTTEIFGPNGTLTGALRQSGTDSALFIDSTYPFVHLAPNGKVFLAIVNRERTSRFLDPVSNVWTALPGLTNYAHATGTSVMYDVGKVLLVGGRALGSVAVAGAEIIDLQGSLIWTPVESMSSPRMHCTSVLLPDGKVFVVGGTRCKGTNSVISEGCKDGAVKTPEIWDPAAAVNQWSVMAPHQEVRVYHSVALLLPDARVLVGGGGLPTAYGEYPGFPDPEPVPDPVGGHANVEIFSPPYLFDRDGSPATRPVITSAPTSVNYGQTFFVGASVSGISKVAWVRLPSVTHGFNQDQRIITDLSPTQVTGGIRVTAPADPNIFPPGYYMLFVFRNGVPSVARIIQAPGVDTVGLFRPSNTTFSLSNKNAAGPADIVAQLGNPTDIPIAGDWDGNGATTIGINRSSNFWALRNSNSSGAGEVAFTFGIAGDKPITGDWNRDGVTTIGVYRASNQTFFLRNSNSTGFADVAFSINWGQGADAIPVAGDWDGDGVSSIGLYFPSTSTFHLRNQNSAGPASLTVQVGASGDLPVVGDWDGDGRTNVGAFRPATATFRLRSRNDSAAPIWVFAYGASGDLPIAGNWRGGQ